MGLDGKGMSSKIQFFSLINFESSDLLHGYGVSCSRIMHDDSIMNMARSTLAVTSMASSYVRRGEWNTLIEAGGRTHSVKYQKR